MHTRVIPSSGAEIPVIGCGTWENFDVGHDERQREPLRQVLDTLFQSGGSIIDSSPMYGAAEKVVGELLKRGNSQSNAFIATKVWTQGREAGIRQMDQSIALLGKVDLMQVHNLVDWRTHLATLRDWKSQGRIRYIGVTHYTSSAYRELESVLRHETLDFVQLNYSLDERETEERLLPLAVHRGAAVIVNRPFGEGHVLRSLHGRTLPAWASEYGCTTWAQLLLKFVLSHPAVTCVIPGTGDPDHMAENCRAGVGKYFGQERHNELCSFWDSKFA
jgi:diketogulonate reductase-like aldo/keto reductase